MDDLRENPRASHPNLDAASSEASEVTVTGHADEPFEAVADVFARMVAAQGSGGAALAIYHDGRPVVDLVGGTYATNSLQLLFSVSKFATAVAAAVAIQRGELDPGEPINNFWPEFRRSSTSSITTDMVLAHRSGLAAIRQATTLDDVLAGVAESLIEREDPIWEPDTAHGYHAFTFGTLMNGIFQRKVGSSVADYLSTEVTGKLDLDLWIGTPASEFSRVRPIRFGDTASTPLGRSRVNAGTIISDTVVGALMQDREVWNEPAVWASEWPATSGISDARSLARLAAATLQPIDGVRLLQPEAVATLARTRSQGIDRVLGVQSRFGRGVQLTFPQLPMLSEGSFGHEGAGGALVVTDPESGVTVGFTTDVHPAVSGASVQSLAILATLRTCLEPVWR